MKTDRLDIRHADCMDLMREFPDKHFDLAVVDPPYGIGKRLSQGAGKLKNSALQNMNSEWDIAPDESYFIELRRVSKEQIVWGGNYFDLPPTRCVLCWDKKQYMPTFSRWEMAWTSYDKPAKMFEDIGGESRIHPTQKPVKLYDWIFANYAEEGMEILDTHLGSGSIAIAAHYAKMKLTASELDEDYYNAACERIERETAQTTLF